MIEIPDSHIDQYIELFGSDAFKQIDILQEECAELIKALSKYKRGFGLFTYKDTIDPIDNVIEELTHVAISSEIVARLLNINKEDIEREVNRKAEMFNLVKGEREMEKHKTSIITSAHTPSQDELEDLFMEGNEVGLLYAKLPKEGNND